MLIQFRIAYKTRFGEQIMITGTHPQLGQGKRENAVAMNYEKYSEGTWTYLIRTDEEYRFGYRYFLREESSGRILEEWGRDRFFDQDETDYCSYDHW